MIVTLLKHKHTLFFLQLYNELYSKLKKSLKVRFITQAGFLQKLNHSILKACLWIIILFIAVCSCNKFNKKAELQLEAIINEQEVDFQEQLGGKEVLFIIPRTGCSGCIGMADLFFKEKNYDPSKVQFVFTKVNSLKTLKIRLGPENLDKNNVYVDKNNLFSTKSLDSIYPIIVHMKSNEILKLEFLSPDNRNVLNKMRQDLAINNK